MTTVWQDVLNRIETHGWKQGSVYLGYEASCLGGHLTEACGLQREELYDSYNHPELYKYLTEIRDLLIEEGYETYVRNSECVVTDFNDNLNTTRERVIALLEELDRRERLGVLDANAVSSS